MKTIMKLSIVVLMVFSTTLVFSQALISDEESPATVDANAMLEIRSTDTDNPGGLLIPRVHLSLSGSEVILQNMETPTDGLLVYNLATEDGPESGLWYYDGVSEKWVLYSRAGSIYSLSVDNFGEIYEDRSESTGTQYTINNSTWTGWASAQDGTESDQFTADWETHFPGETGAPGDFLQIDGAAPAYYTVNVSMVVKSNSSGITFTAQLWWTPDGEAAEKIGGAFVKHHFQTGDEFATLSTSALVLLGPGDKVDVRMMSLTASESIDVEGMNLRLAKVGEAAPPATP